MRSAITSPNVNRFGWNLKLHEPHVRGWCWQILGAIRAVLTVWEADEILFFCAVNNARFHWIPFGKNHDIWTQQCQSVSLCKLSEQNFPNFTTRGRYSKKTQKLLNKFPGLATSGRHNSTKITSAENARPNCPSTGCLVSIFTVRINSKSFSCLGRTLRTGSPPSNFFTILITT